MFIIKWSLFCQTKQCVLVPGMSLGRGKARKQFLNTVGFCRFPWVLKTLQARFQQVIFRIALQTFFSFVKAGKREQSENVSQEINTFHRIHG